MSEGSAYVFYNHTGFGWSQVVKLMAPDGEVGDLYGISAVVFNEIIVIGACNDGAGESTILICFYSSHSFIQVQRMFTTRLQILHLGGAKFLSLLLQMDKAETILEFLLRLLRMSSLLELANQA